MAPDLHDKAMSAADRLRDLPRTAIAALRSGPGRAIVLYAIAFGMAGLTPFVLLPILTRALNPPEFGQASSWIILAGLLANIGGLTVHGLVSVRYFRVERAVLRRLVTTALVLVALVHGAFVAWLAVGPDPAAGFTHLPKAFTIGAALVAVAICFNLVGLAVVQVSNRPGLYLASRVLQSFVEIVGCIVLLRLLGDAPEARIHSYAAAVAVCAACAMVFLVAQGLLARSPDRESARDALRFGVPTVPHVVAGQLLSNLDRLMVSYLLGIEQLGVFMVASQLGMALSMVVEPLNRALAPWLFEQLARDDETQKRQIVRATYALFAGLLALALVSAAAFMAVFGYIFPPEYAPAKAVIPAIALGMAFQGMYYGVVNYVFYAEATGRLSIVSATTVSLATVWSYLLISRWGLIGAGISFMLTNLVLFLAVWLLSAKVLPMPWLAGPSGIGVGGRDRL